MDYCCNCINCLYGKCVCRESPRYGDTVFDGEQTKSGCGCFDDDICGYDKE